MISKISEPRFLSILTLDRLTLTRRAVDSIFENSVEDVILVFLDNGSVDGTQDYLDELTNQHPRQVHVIKSSTNLGVAAGRNRVFKYIQDTYGDRFKWILNLDNDCIVQKGYDVALSKCIDKTGAAAVYPHIIEPDGSLFCDPTRGFLVNLHEKKLRLEYGDQLRSERQPVAPTERIRTDVKLGSSAVTPKFLNRIGYYDEGHVIGWEDYSIALRALGLKKSNFDRWRKERYCGEATWVQVRNLIGPDHQPDACVWFEPECIITHHHPTSDEFSDYESIRWKSEVIEDSTRHFERTWGLTPII